MSIDFVSLLTLLARLVALNAAICDVQPRPEPLAPASGSIRPSWVAPITGGAIGAEISAEGRFEVSGWPSQSPAVRLGAVALSHYRPGGGLIVRDDSWWSATSGFREGRSLTAFVAGTGLTPSEPSFVEHPFGRGTALVLIEDEQPSALAMFINPNDSLEVVELRPGGIAGRWEIRDVASGTLTSAGGAARRLPDGRIVLASIEGRDLDRIVLRILDERSEAYDGEQIALPSTARYHALGMAAGNRFVAVVARDLDATPRILATLIDVETGEVGGWKVVSDEQIPTSHFYDPVIEALDGEFITTWVERQGGESRICARAIHTDGELGPVVKFPDAVLDGSAHLQLQLQPAGDSLALVWRDNEGFSTLRVMPPFDQFALARALLDRACREP